MRPTVKVLFAMILAYITAPAQDHIPVPHQHVDSSRICWGYAMGRAGGKYDGDGTCNPVTLIPDDPGISGTYFWRRVKENGVLQSPTQIATVNRGTTSYIDYDYLITSGYTDDICYYDVRSVFVVQGQATQYRFTATPTDGSKAVVRSGKLVLMR